MTPAARIAAVADLLDQILDGEPAEKVLTSWARRSRFAGSKDRAAVRDLVFDALRCRRSFAALGGSDTGRGLMLGTVVAAGTDPATVFTGEGHAPAPLTDQEVAQLAENAGRSMADAVASDMPDWLWSELEASLEADTRAVCDTLKTRAPVFLRVNLRKTNRAAAQAALSEDGIKTTPHANVDTALEVTEGARRIAQSRAYTDGLVELQDAASQAVAAALPLRDGMSVLDFCAGGGGKTLAMAGLAKASFTAHDANPGRLKDLPARASRAGIKVTVAQAPKGTHDLVLCDVPCSGSGSWRRSPEGKWTLTPEALTRLNATQDAILDQSAPLVAEQGTLAYVTCSILRMENQMRAQAFLDRHPEWEQTSENAWLPGPDGDGFYLALFSRR